MTAAFGVTGDTRVFVQGRGIVPVFDIIDVPTIALDADNAWSKVTFQSAGKQDIAVIGGPRSDSKSWYSATTLHQGLRGYDGATVSAGTVKPPYRLASIGPRVYDRDEDFACGLAHALIVMDVAEQEQYGSSNIRLSEPFAELSEHFEDFGPVQNKRDGSVIVRVPELPDGVDEILPDDLNTENYLRGFILGWIAATGLMSEEGRVIIHADATEFEWLLNYAPIAGITWIDVKDPSANKRNPVWEITIDSLSLPLDDVLMSSERERFAANPWPCLEVRSFDICHDEVYATKPYVPLSLAFGPVMA